MNWNKVTVRGWIFIGNTLIQDLPLGVLITVFKEGGTAVDYKRFIRK